MNGNLSLSELRTESLSKEAGIASMVGKNFGKALGTLTGKVGNAASKVGNAASTVANKASNALNTAGRSTVLGGAIMADGVGANRLANKILDYASQKNRLSYKLIGTGVVGAAGYGVKKQLFNNNQN